MLELYFFVTFIFTTISVLFLSKYLRESRQMERIELIRNRRKYICNFKLDRYETYTTEGLRSVRITNRISKPGFRNAPQRDSRVSCFYDIG